MNPLLRTLFLAAGVTAGAELAVALLLMMLPRLGRPGMRLVDAFARAPLLDGIVAALTWLPWLIAGLWAGWPGLAGCVVGQIAALYLWVFLNEMTHRQAARGPRIVRFLNRTVGRWRNHGALLVTLIAAPGFWLIRLHEILVYPLLIWLLGFPRYQHGEWINVSRQKFDGLVGHDLVWCLYCDWMTGVYCLGAEMLRNVESFWCPIRFYDGKKCANCRTDFPDLVDGWVPADGNMQDVEARLEQMYSGGQRTWFGHPTRLTARGQPVVQPRDGSL